MQIFYVFAVHEGMVDWYLGNDVLLWDQFKAYLHDFKRTHIYSSSNTQLTPDVLHYSTWLLPTPFDLGKHPLRSPQLAIWWWFLVHLSHPPPFLDKLVGSPLVAIWPHSILLILGHFHLLILLSPSSWSGSSFNLYTPSLWMMLQHLFPWVWSPLISIL